MRIKQLTTAEELWEMPEVPGKMLELVRGEVVEVPGAEYEHAQLVRLLLRLLDGWAISHDPGEVFPDSLAYILSRSPDIVRIPDVSFIARDRIPSEGIIGFVPFAPDLAVEIVSPNDRAEDVHAKVSEYMEAGTRLVWVLWPKQRGVTVHWQGSIQELGPEDALDGGEVLPGFRVRVGELFDVQTASRSHERQ